MNNILGDVTSPIWQCDTANVVNYVESALEFINFLELRYFQLLSNFNLYENER